MTQEQAAAQHQPLGQPADVEARDLRREYAGKDCVRISEAPDREMVRLRGSLRTVSLRPRAGIPALEAELFDGSGVITIVWLGRRRIAGHRPRPVDPGAGPDRRARRRPHDVQPALRAHPVTEPVTEPGPEAATEAAPEKKAATTETVEEVVRRQLATALGGRRGMLEAAVPTIVFTALWLTTRELRLALVVSVGARPCCCSPSGSSSAPASSS